MTLLLLAVLALPAEAGWTRLGDKDRLEFWVPDAMRVSRVGPYSIDAALDGSTFVVSYRHVYGNADEFMGGRLSYELESSWGIRRGKLTGEPECLALPGTYRNLTVCVTSVTGKLGGEQGEWGLVHAREIGGTNGIAVLVGGTAEDMAASQPLLIDMIRGWRFITEAEWAAAEAAAPAQAVDPGRKVPGPCSAVYSEDVGRIIEHQLTWTWDGDVLRSERDTWKTLAGAVVFQQTDHEYDPAGRRVRSTITHDGGGVVAHIAYDYDTAGRLVREAQTGPDGGEADVTTYEYDDQGRIARTVYPGGTAYATTYDARGRRATSGSATATWSDDGLTETLLLSDGTTNTLQYDRHGNLHQETRSASPTLGKRYDYACWTR